MTDQETVLKAFADLQKIAAEYLQSDAVTFQVWRRGNNLRNHEATIRTMLQIIDNEEVVAAAGRLRKGFGLKVVK